MGAEPWSYFTGYDANVQRALEKLRNEEFAAGRFRYSEEDPQTIEESLEIADADGTASILDMLTVSPTPDFNAVAPFTPDELQQFFGTTQPTRQMIEDNYDCFEELERGHGRYAVVYDSGRPKELYFAGYSFD